MGTFHCRTLSDLPSVAEVIIQTHPTDRVFAFYGQMGSGKTTLIKEICHYLNVNEVVNSPSFSIVNEYKTRDQKSIYHFDFYRIKKISEAYDIGFEEYLYSSFYCFIEWPEMIEELLPGNYVYIKIEEQPDKSRLITF